MRHNIGHSTTDLLNCNFPTIFQQGLGAFFASGIIFLFTVLGGKTSRAFQSRVALLYRKSAYLSGAILLLTYLLEVQYLLVN